MDPMAMMGVGGGQMGPMMGGMLAGMPGGMRQGQPCPECGAPPGQCDCQAGQMGAPQQWAQQENGAPSSDMMQDPYSMGSVNLGLMLGDAMAPQDMAGPPMDMILQLLGQQGQQMGAPQMAPQQMGAPGMAPGMPMR